MPVRVRQVKKMETFWPPKFLVVLATVFLAIWIIVGLFFLTLIYQEIRLGAFKNLLGPVPSQSAADSQAPKEADLPGIGKVDVDCVQKALSSQSIQKILQEQNSNSLSNDDKSKLEKCIIEKPKSPQPSPTS